MKKKNNGKGIEIFLTKMHGVYLLNGPDVRTFNE